MGAERKRSESQPRILLMGSSWFHAHAANLFVVVSLCCFVADRFKSFIDSYESDDFGHSNCTRPILVLLGGLWCWCVILQILGKYGIDPYDILSGRSKILEDKDAKAPRSSAKLAAQRLRLVAAVCTLVFTILHYATRAFYARRRIFGHSEMWHVVAILIFMQIIIGGCCVGFVGGFDRRCQRFHGPALIGELAAVVLAFWRVLGSPFTVVTFSEVLVGDWLTSFSKLLGDLGICACTLLKDASELEEIKPDVVTTECLQSFTTPLIVSLPYLWRFLQCGRCYMITGELKHVANAVKYLSGIATVCASTYKRVGGLAAIFWISVLFNSLYSFWWDCCMDWGLFEIRSLRQGKLRRKLTYRPAAYICAVILDLCLRVSWSLKLSSSYALIIPDGQYSALLGQALEVFRRSVWTCFRIEYEHAKLLGDYKPVPACPNDSDKNLSTKDAAVMTL